ncbi:MAG: hypothetical protein Q7T86_16210 [Hyphomicrobiaceae bacterium]|nr:hypothetical protein [Hyphomicrobiaceae bacterium]
MRSFSISLLGAVASMALSLAAVAQAPAPEPAPPAVRATVNGEKIMSDAVEARQYDLIAKDTILESVLTESRQLSRLPAVAQDLKGLMTAVVQENPDASKEAIMAIVQEKSVAYTQVLAVRKVRPKLFADVEAKAIDELIDEQLMLQDAKKQNLAADDGAAAKAVEGLPKRAGADGEPLHKLLVAWDKRALPSATARIKAQMAWKASVNARLGSEPDDATLAKELAALKQGAKIEKP